MNNEHQQPSQAGMHLIDAPLWEAIVLFIPHPPLVLTAGTDVPWREHRLTVAAQDRNEARDTANRRTRERYGHRIGICSTDVYPGRTARERETDAWLAPRIARMITCADPALVRHRFDTVAQNVYRDLPSGDYGMGDVRRALADWLDER